MAEKECTRCRAVRPLADFPLYNGKPIARCAACLAQDRRERSARWRRRHPEKARQVNRDCAKRRLHLARAWRQKDYAKSPEKWRLRQMKNKLRITYGMSLADYNAMLNAQLGCCAICGAPFSDDKQSHRPHVDHCHATGSVRGLLCLSCNSVLGHAKDSPRILDAAAEYLRKHFAGQAELRLA